MPRPQRRFGYGPVHGPSGGCDTLAGALSQNGLQFSTATPGPVALPPVASLECGLTFSAHDETISVEIYDPEGGDEGPDLCRTFRRAGFSLAPDFHWGMICAFARSGATGSSSQELALAALVTCAPSGFPAGNSAG